MPSVIPRRPKVAWTARARRGLRARARALVVTLLLVSGVSPAAAEELLVSAAISLKDPLEQIGRRFAGARDAAVRFNFGASGELQRQIEAGAPVDVFVSASAREVDALVAAGRVDAATRRLVAGNVLIAIKPSDLPLDLPGPSDLLDRRVRRVALGNPRTVPAGQYARQSLEALGLWARIEPKMVFAENVRQVLDWVARGEVDVGFVYATDAVLRRDQVRLAFPVPDDTHAPIVYVAAVVAATRQPERARAFVDVLASRDAELVFRRFGFEPAPRAGAETPARPR